MAEGMSDAEKDTAVSSVCVWVGGGGMCYSNMLMNVFGCGIRTYVCIYYICVCISACIWGYIQYKK